MLYVCIITFNTYIKKTVRNETHQRDYQSVLCEFALETVEFCLIFYIFVYRFCTYNILYSLILIA